MLYPLYLSLDPPPASPIESNCVGDRSADELFRVVQFPGLLARASGGGHCCSGKRQRGDSNHGRVSPVLPSVTCHVAFSRHPMPQTTGRPCSPWDAPSLSGDNFIARSMSIASYSREVSTSRWGIIVTSLGKSGNFCYTIIIVSVREVR